MIVGDRLQELRKDAGLTQKELAIILSISEKSIGLYENERAAPSDETKIAIAQHFDVSLDYLLGLTNKRVTFKRTMSIDMPSNSTPEFEADLKNMIEILKIKYHIK